MTARIPLRGRSGIVGYALVDLEDEARLAQYRWRLTRHGYVIRHDYVGKRQITVYMHREVLGLRYGDPERVDHINRDGLDNRRSNLRLASHAQNMQNRPANGGSSGYRGVHWDAHHKRWRAVVRHEGRNRHLGYFHCEIVAAAAAEAFRSQHMPFAMPDPLLALHLDAVSTTSTSIRQGLSDEEIAA